MAKKYLIRWDCGYGDNFIVAEADSRDAAEDIAYQEWRDAAETQADYEANEATSENLYEAGFDPEEFGLPPYDD